MSLTCKASTCLLLAVLLLMMANGCRTPDLDMSEHCGKSKTPDFTGVIKVEGITDSKLVKRIVETLEKSGWGRERQLRFRLLSEASGMSWVGYSESASVASELSLSSNTWRTT